MAILKSVVDVNNGNTGWTKLDVLDALETVFANLGWNNGTASSGVPCVVKAPGFTTTQYSTTDYQYSQESTGRTANFEHCGGSYPASTAWKTRYFKVSNNGTTAYRMLEEFRFNGTSQVNDTENSIYDDRHGIQTGDAIHYAAGITSPDPAYVIGGLTADTIYYAIKVDENNFKVAANATDASNGTAIDISPATTSGYYFQRADDAAYDNYTIRVKLGDKLNFDTTNASGAGGNLSLLYNSDDYDVEKVLTSYTYNWQTAPTGYGTDTVVWDTRGYRQSEDEALRPLRWAHEGSGTSLGDYGITKYVYANDTNASMKGEIILEPFISTNGTSNYSPYWKYTVPASGGRSELKLRVYRGNLWYHNPYIVAITINSIGSGWTDNEVFTIPGDQIGGVSPANDLTFGVNADESSTNAYDGTPSIGVTNLGAGSNFFQKHPSGYYGIARVAHDPGKTYGTTYYGFGMGYDTDYYMNITSGSNWNWLNRPGIHHFTNNNNTDFGNYDGQAGLDYQTSQSYISRNNDGDWRRLQYCSTSTPTAYPLQIRVYRAQAPQDTNFAIIQFAQVINGIVQPYGTFSISKGTTFGSGVYDLDYVFQDGLTEFTTSTRSISTTFGDTGYEYYSGQAEPVNSGGKARAATYGYLREGDNSNSVRRTSTYACNIDTNNLTDGREIVTYYRNSNYDRYGSNSVSSSADYYRPIKGLPISHNILPVPFYMPDDFVMLQVGTTPGLVSFRTGDTVTISPSEVYEIILAGYQTQQNGLDNINNNSTIGMLFMARTT